MLLPLVAARYRVIIALLIGVHIVEWYGKFQ